MIKPKNRLIITFYTTTDAMAMEHFCKAETMEGRMIPVPGTISADCGLAWCAKPESEGALRELMDRHGIPTQGVYRCLI